MAHLKEEVTLLPSRGLDVTCLSLLASLSSDD